MTHIQRAVSAKPAFIGVTIGDRMNHKNTLNVKPRAIRILSGVTMVFALAARYAGIGGNV